MSNEVGPDAEPRGTAEGYSDAQFQFDVDRVAGGIDEIVVKAIREDLAGKTRMFRA